jgi:gamma-glutamylcyclotransferase (GGCT)/AIG2-like uncharacterized protein YtfP
MVTVDLTKYSKKELNVSMEELNNLAPPSNSLKEKEDLHCVFVYGSLMSGYKNNYLLANSKRVPGFFSTKQKFCLVTFGEYPAMLKSSELYILNTPAYKARSRSLYRNVAGEVYECSKDVLSSLDFLESNGKFYKRELIELKDYPKKVWAYILMEQHIPYLDFNLCKTTVDDCYSWKATKS